MPGHTLYACLPRFGTYISHQLGFRLRSAWHGWKGCKIPSFLPPTFEVLNSFRNRSCELPRTTDGNKWGALSGESGGLFSVIPFRPGHFSASPPAAVPVSTGGVRFPNDARDSLLSSGQLCHNRNNGGLPDFSSPKPGPKEPNHAYHGQMVAWFPIP